MAAHEHLNPDQVGRREGVATRWVVQHHPGNEGYTISDNFTTEEAAQSFAERQIAKGRTIRSIKRDDAFRLDY